MKFYTENETLDKVIGCNVTFSTVARLFNAMNIRVMLDLGSMGKVALF